MIFYKYTTKHFLALRELTKYGEETQTVNQGEVGGKDKLLQNALLDSFLSPAPTAEVFSLVCWEQDFIFFMLFAPISSLSTYFFSQYEG